MGKNDISRRRLVGAGAERAASAFRSPSTIANAQTEKDQTETETRMEDPVSKYPKPPFQSGTPNPGPVWPRT